MLVVYMMYQGIIVLKNFGFVRPRLERKTDKPAFSKISSLGIVYENLRFWCPKMPFTCEQKEIWERQKTSVFENIRNITCGLGQKLNGSFSPVQGLPLSGRPPYPLKHLQSDILELPVRLLPEFSGQAWQRVVEPLLYVWTGHATVSQRRNTNNKIW